MTVTPVLTATSPNTDRTYLVPPHIGSNVFPNNAIFSKLLRHARRNRVAIRDVRLGVERTYGHLLADVLALRTRLEAALDPRTLRSLERGDEVYIGVLAAGGYEFTVAVLTVLAVGAAVVPMSVTVPVEEAAYFASKARLVAIVTSSEAASLGNSISKYVNKQGLNVQIIEVLPHLPENPIFTPFEMVISSNRFLDDNSAGVVIFTSGTTGRPKGAVMRRAYTHETALAIGEGYDIDHNDVILHVLPVHHTTGLGTSFFAFLVRGACIEFNSVSFDPAWIWERWRQGGITVFSAVPTMYMRLKWFYEQNLAKLPEIERLRYTNAVAQLRAMLCGSSALQQHIQDFWTGIRNGKPILTRYGASEFPACLRVPAGVNLKALPRGCVGTTVPGVDLKLTEGEHGELLVKSPYMFSKYLFDEEATAAAHDKDGYFRTGDIVRRDGPYYFIIGRASLDIIKSGGYKISALDIERECLDLPYIAEALIIGVEDEEFGQRVGAIVTLRADHSTYLHAKGRRALTLDALRADLRMKLVGYKLPTLLRVLEGELPKGPTGKIQKKVLGPQFFPCPGWQTHPEVQVWRKKTPQIKARL